MDKFENDKGQIGVIVSCGYGAGWSTWGDDSEFLSMDKTLVDMKLNDVSEDIVEEYCKEEKKLDQYMGGWKDAEVKWLDKGDSFRIDEYDGNESLILTSDLNLTA
jgi:hypothetical protein